MIQISLDILERVNVFLYVFSFCRLEVKSEKVKDVYRAAMMLKMQRVAEACSSHLASILSPQNCLGTFLTSYMYLRYMCMTIVEMIEFVSSRYM